jgi:hypothetical protein
VSEPGFTPSECREILFRVAKLRLPDTRKTVDPVPDEEFGGMPAPMGAMKVHELEGYMVDCAIGRGEAEEAALYMQAAVKKLEDDWDQIEGWQTNLPPNPKERTKGAVVEAKRMLRPDLYDGIREGKWLADKLKSQSAVSNATRKPARGSTR